MNGIIPARAGFTRPSTPVTRSRLDHPRSRGVYKGHQGHGVVKTGSSPLARGLLMRSLVIGNSIRDHPRSRGVYPFSVVISSVAPGSSPLARGLRADIISDETGHGIIPARAGFTRGRQADRRGCRDHPRSRGVYSPTMRRKSGNGGSSPLARGLPNNRRSRDKTPRIIPARAGFTPAEGGAGPKPGDHPRSRGVYAGRRLRQAGLRGSSPLARGLREETA